jgi:hypothetical protein
MPNPLVATSCVAISGSRYSLNVFIACSAFWLDNVITSRVLMCQVSVHYALYFWDVLHNYTHFYIAEIVSIRYTSYKSSLVCIRRAILILQAYSREHREMLQVWSHRTKFYSNTLQANPYVSLRHRDYAYRAAEKATKETSSSFNHIFSV